MVCPEEQEYCWADEVDSCTEWVRVLVSHTLVITARQAFTQHSNDVIQSQHALLVPEDTSPAVLSKALVTHLHVHGLVMHAYTQHVHTNIHSQSDSCKYTPKHTHYPTHTNTPAVCPEALALLFVSSPLFRERPGLSQAS